MVADVLSQVEHKRYVIHEMLGFGGMGAVYRATDRLTGQPVAIKRLLAPAERLIFTTRSEGTDLRLALAQEFRYLASLRHPNIISVLDYGFDQQRQPYFTMELLSNAKTVVKAAKEHEIQHKLEMLTQVLQALAYLHRRGIIHRDLKPGNVLASGDQVKVLDFGLSTMGGHDDRSGSTTSGTLAYMAPEVLSGQAATEAADIYAFGLIAYEVLVGNFPFDTTNMTDLMHNILHTTPEISLPGADPRLEPLLHRLLAKNPTDRLNDIRHIITALSEISERQFPVETAAVRESFLQAARLVGRDSELAQLSSALDQIFDGKGGAWLLAGESGVGKSRLLEELRTLAMVKGALALKGQAISEGSVVYQLWRDVVRWLSLFTDDLSDFEASVLKGVVPDIGGLIGREVHDAPELTPQAEQARLLGVIEGIFKRQKQPIVLILEDIHWSGTSLDILAQLIRLTASQPLLIIASFRDDERPEIPQKFPEMQVLKLSRLSQDGIAELAESMIGSAGRGEQLVTLLARETEGNVFFLVEVVRALAEETGQLDQIAVAELPQNVLSGGIRQIVQRRLNRVPLAARSLLEAAAVAGRMLDLAVLRRVDPAIDLQHWLAMCSEAAVLEVQDERWRFAHDKLREGMLESLSAERKIELNRTIAQAIEAAYPEAIQMAAALAHHWGQAGDRGKEARYAFLAGKAAARVYADTQARKFYTQAVEAFATLPETSEYDQMRVDTLVGLVSVSFAADSPEANLARLDQAETLVKALPGPDGTPGSDKRRLAHVLLWKGRILYYRGSPREAIAFFQQVLPLGKELADEQLIAIPASFIAQALITAGQFAKALPLLQQAVAPLERTASWPEWIRVMIFWGLAVTAGGDYVEGKRLIEQGYAKSVETKNLNAIGTCELLFALMYITVHDAQPLLQRSLIVLENAQKTGDKLHQFWGNGFAGFAYCWMGDLDKASQMLETVQTIGAAIGPRIVVSDWFAVLAAEIALRKGRPDEALAAAEKAVEVTKDMGSIYTEGMSHRLWGQSLLLYTPPRLDEAEAQVMSAISLLEAGRGLVEAARCQVVLGRIYSQRNEPEKAREYLEKALIQFETTGLHGESSEVIQMLETLRA